LLTIVCLIIEHIVVGFGHQQRSILPQSPSG
jgi:hypothetical protein